MSEQIRIPPRCSGRPWTAAEHRACRSLVLMALAHHQPCSGAALEQALKERGVQVPAHHIRMILRAELDRGGVRKVGRTKGARWAVVS